MDTQNSTEIRHTLRAFRREALTQFINEFMIILVQEGYSFEDLLEAITNWTNQNPKLAPAVKHLEEAAAIARTANKR